MLGKKLKQKAFIVALHLTVTAYILLYTCTFTYCKGMNTLTFWVKLCIIMNTLPDNQTTNDDNSYSKQRYCNT